MVDLREIKRIWNKCNRNKPMDRKPFSDTILEQCDR